MATRRELEQNVIAAARRVVAISLPNAALLDLQSALIELDLLREPSGPRTARCAPVTSHQAAKWVNGLGKSLQSRIATALYWGPWLTVDEMMVRFKTSHQSTSARVNEMSNAGWLMDSGTTRRTRSGMEAIVWRLTLNAEAAMKEGYGPHGTF